ncbi:MAG: hypothetical protein AAFX93_20155 [Verrucomicrobiota bacterium]
MSVGCCLEFRELFVLIQPHQVELFLLEIVVLREDACLTAGIMNAYDSLLHAA